jgi:hypothetical protein
MKAIAITAGILLAVVLLLWLGLQPQPGPFPPITQQPTELKTVPIPDNLPSPVERFYQELYGDELPVVESAIVSGRASIRIAGITFPGRVRFIHDAGEGYRHYIETTVYTLPLMRVNEYYLDGKTRLELPFGVTEDEAKVDQAANLGLWAESLAWLPSILVTDTRVHWEPIDDRTAVLVVPYHDSPQRIIVRFDPATGLPHMMEAMRYKGAESTEKTLWLNEAVSWGDINGNPALRIGSLTWYDEGSPWLQFSIDELVYNTDVREKIRAEGP